MSENEWDFFEFEVWQDDMMQASASSASLIIAYQDAMHYALIYGQDGPVRICQVTRKWVELDSPPAASGNSEQLAVE